MPRIEPAADKRDLVIETAYRLFKRDGFHATGIDRIIAEAGVAKMTMYRYFPSKEELIVAVLAWRAARFGEQLDRAVPRGGTPDKKIAAVLAWHGAGSKAPSFMAACFSTRSQSSAIHRIRFMSRRRGRSTICSNGLPRSLSHACLLAVHAKQR